MSPDLRPGRDKRSSLRSDEKYILQNRGIKSTKDIAAHLGVTHRVIQHSYQNLDVSPYKTADGRVTASEYARMTNQSLSWVIEQIQRGIIKAEKGQDWLIDPIAQKSKDWNGRSLDWEKLISPEQEGCCINCGNLLVGIKAKICCSKPCRAEFTELWNRSRVEGSIGPSYFLPSFLKFPYQRWLIEEIGGINSLPWVKNPAALKLKNSAVVTSKEKQIHWAISEVWKAYPDGLAITPQYIGALLSDGAEDFGLTVDPVTGLVPVAGTEIRTVANSLERSDTIVELAGYEAFGIGSVWRLNLGELVFLNLLYQKFGRPVRRDYLEANITRFLSPQVDLEALTKACNGKLYSYHQRVGYDDVVRSGYTRGHFYLTKL